ncbi:hypothetical protein FDB30_11755 [Clostridium botulinum]|uniref:hypothetical protein n=1 Tax=Clostridium botulinum TaxID=1491 RepID=UPI000773D5B3|nr:hypothetical protein [Clostridium botulinum]MBN1049451.1 hypothetical protein [Clostridium botulinum]MBN1078434.1 hypothetical protein [Clostridium botulinum]NFE85339.1 hypothetical protein [Clostridium botulinum]NFG38941.1 hypothetical protein [Clostridium botulinum]NFN29698.1 hypothetical protein [Clostridium botulinum]
MSKEGDENRVKLDEVLKSLFNVSKKVLIEMMNSLFHENYDIDSTEITFENNEFVTDDYDIIRGDLFLKISNDNKPYHYHIELQTKNDKTMVIRMFEYGFKKAKELSRCESDNDNSDDETLIYIPKQLVMFIEENRNIKDELKMKLVFPDGQIVNYKVSVLKCWEYDDKRFIEEKMYPLLPLQIFKLRYEMESIKRRSNGDKNKLNEAILNAKELAQTVANESKSLYDQEIVDGEDLHKILLAIGNLFEYLNDKYGDDKKLNEEVLKMTKTLYDPEVEKRGIEKGIEKGEEKKAIETARIAIKKGLSNELICELTGLSCEEINSIRQSASH